MGILGHKEYIERTKIIIFWDKLKTLEGFKVLKNLVIKTNKMSWLSVFLMGVIHMIIIMKGKFSCSNGVQ